jgi:putative ABC transport system permease protein
MMNDFRHAFRLLIKSPGFSAIVIATLAIAIGVNSAIFSIVNDLLLRPIVPLRPKEVVNIFTGRKEANRDYRQFSYAEFNAMREPNPIFADVAALGFTMTGVGHDESLRRSFAFFSSDNIFALLGVKPAAGRFYNAAEARPNANIPVAVASYALWQSMGGRPEFIGSTLDVNGQPFTVIGVTPRGFTGVNAMVSPDVWLPLGVYGNGRFTGPFEEAGPSSDLASPTTFALNVMGRLQPGVDLKSAASQLPVLGKRVESAGPSDAAGKRELEIQYPSRLSLSTGPSADGPTLGIAALLVAMAGVVLLIASLNLANMMLARGTARCREFAVRLSLGAPRWRIVRQLVVEGLVLALLGGAMGLLLAQWSDELLSQSLNGLFRSMSLSSAIDLRPDGTVLVATVIFCVAATLIFSLIPAMKSVQVDMVHDLKQQAGDSASSGRWNRFFSGRNCLVMTQVSLSLVLLFSGGLFLRGALKAAALNLGFDTSGSIVAEIDYSMSHTSDSVARQRMQTILSRVRELPGVRQAALASLVPYTNIMITRRAVPAETAAVTDPKAPKPGFDGIYSAVSPGFFDSIGVRLLRGRTFTAAEAESREAPPVVILDEQMAKSLFPQGEALGRRVRLDPIVDGAKAMEVVGIVSAHRQQPGTDKPSLRIYVPLARSSAAATFMDVRLATDDPRVAAMAIGTLRRELIAIDPNVPLLRLQPLSQIVDNNFYLWIVRMGAIMFGAFGAIALLLATVGVYGVKAYTVARRTREIGIRMALGARSNDVLALVMRQAMLQTAVGLAAGTVLALIVGRLLASALFNVSPADFLVLGTSAAILAVTTVFACWLPARRATRVNPVEALRTE